ncbi:MAG TPA: nicotinate-nicotinamide nucleotide adenylyltransferase [Ardenticatenaceae bacterium]|jgi:nicotinate (nicotinamide) nucleotide adenylyltransferase
MSQPYVLVYGLSANPIHQAHVNLLVDATRALLARGYNVVRVLLIPVYRRNPVGSTSKGNLPESYEHRLAMSQLAAQEIARALNGQVESVEVSRIEEQLAKSSTTPNYTVQTLSVLQEGSPGLGWIFLMSSDLVSGEKPEFGRWYQPDRLVQLATIALAPRPGYDRNEAFLEQYEQKGGRFVYLNELSPPEISATAIRERLQAGEDPLVLSEEGLLLEPVAAYIREHSLYNSA